MKQKVLDHLDELNAVALTYHNIARLAHQFGRLDSFDSAIKSNAELTYRGPLHIKSAQGFLDTTLKPLISAYDTLEDQVRPVYDLLLGNDHLRTFVWPHKGYLLRYYDELKAFSEIDVMQPYHSKEIAQAQKRFRALKGEPMHKYAPEFVSSEVGAALIDIGLETIEVLEDSKENQSKKEGLTSNQTLLQIQNILDLAFNNTKDTILDALSKKKDEFLPQSEAA